LRLSSTLAVDGHNFYDLEYFHALSILKTVAIELAVCDVVIGDEVEAT
jgi:hypothetical protein